MKLFFKICCFVLCFQSAEAQLILNPRFFGSYMVNNQGDTIKGMVKLPKSASKGDFSYTDIMWKVRFIYRDGMEQKITPNEVRQVTFWLENGKEFTFTSHPNTIKAFAGVMNDNHKMFLERVKNGQIKLYKGYFYNSNGTGLDEISTIDFIQKGQGPVRKFRYLFFRYDLIEYVKDNSNLVQKLRKHHYQPRDIDEIVQEYNTWYAENSTKN